MDIYVQKGEISVHVKVFMEHTCILMNIIKSETSETETKIWKLWKVSLIW